MSKYELTSTTITFYEHTLHQIRALKDFSNVKTGDLGGYIEKEENLSQIGNCWVYGQAKVYGDAWVSGDAQVYGDALVYGNTRVYGKAQVYDDAQVCGEAQVCGQAKVFGKAQVFGNAKVFGNAYVYENAQVYGKAVVSGQAYVCGQAYVYGNSEITKGIGSITFIDLKIDNNNNDPIKAIENFLKEHVDLLPLLINKDDILKSIALKLMQKI